MRLAAAYFSATVILAAAPAPAIDDARFFAVIGQLEGHAWTDPGGALALSRSAWSQHTRLPYRYASFPDFALPVAERHLTWLARSLVEFGRTPSVHNLAGCWRYGLDRWIKGASADYANRAHLLYYSNHHLALRR
jgi:hypothetical protein